jgi:hypothetical protein
VDGLDWCSTILTNPGLEMNLITARIVKSAALECDWAGVVEETSSPASAVGGSSREPVLTLPPGKNSPVPDRPDGHLTQPGDDQGGGVSFAS